MLYQRKLLVDGTVIGEPGPLPHNIENLNDADLADLTAAIGLASASELGFDGQGFFPMTRKLTAIAFKFRITAAERIAIRVAAATNPIIADFLDILATTPIVELDNEATIAGLAYLVSLTLLTADRAAEIRA